MAKNPVGDGQRNGPDTVVVGWVVVVGGWVEVVVVVGGGVVVVVVVVVVVLVVVVGPLSKKIIRSETAFKGKSFYFCTVRIVRIHSWMKIHQRWMFQDIAVRSILLDLLKIQLMFL